MKADIERNSALRAEPASRVFSAIADLTDDEIQSMCFRVVTSAFIADDGDVDYLRYDAAVVRAVVTELATRCRAEGGGTSDKSSEVGGLLGDSKTAETRMGTGFEGGHLDSAPAAGTENDAERLVPRTDDFGTVWMVTPEKAAEIDAAAAAADEFVGAHAKSGKERDAAAETMDHTQLQALGQHQEKS